MTVGLRVLLQLNIHSRALLLVLLPVCLPSLLACLECGTGDVREGRSCVRLCNNNGDCVDGNHCEDGRCADGAPATVADAGIPVASAMSTSSSGSSTGSSSSLVSSTSSPSSVTSSASVSSSTSSSSSTGGILDASVAPDANHDDGGESPDANGSDPGDAGVPAKKCDDGVDNDFNGQVDCQDAACVSHACHAVAPLGWAGPGAFYLNSPGNVPACPADVVSSVAGKVNFNALAGACSACGCGAPSGGTCGRPVLRSYGDDNCGGNPVGTYQLVANACRNWSSETQSIEIDPIPATNTMCTVTGGQPSIPTPTFSQDALACAQPLGGGCGNGEVCAAHAAPPFGATSLCIFAAGDVPCPTGEYSARTVLYTGFTDDRRCNACACGVGTGSTCPGALTAYDSGTCSGGDPNLTITAAIVPDCLDGNDALDSVLLTVTGPPGGGACPSSGGGLVGSASPTGPMTVCCPQD